jgi:hypothetical protein
MCDLEVWNVPLRGWMYVLPSWMVVGAILAIFPVTTPDSASGGK